MKYILKREDIDNESKNFLEALSSTTNEQFKEIVYLNDIELNNYIKIVKIHSDCYSISLNLPIDEKFLLSFGNPEQLDGVCYDVEAVIWNEIILNDEDIQQYNMYTVEQENIFDLYYEIEQEILNAELTVDNNFNGIDLISLIDVDYFIDKYFEYKDKVNIEILKELIEQGINVLDTWITEIVKEYFESDNYYDLIYDIENYEIDYMLEEINKKGFIEVYI